MDIRRLDPQDQAALERFVEQIPEGDRTFFKEDVSDPEVVTAWSNRGATRSIAVDDGAVVGYLAVIPLQGWSSHVGRGARDRRAGPPRPRHRPRPRPARGARGVELGLRKMVVEVVADQDRQSRCSARSASNPRRCSPIMSATRRAGCAT